MNARLLGACGITAASGSRRPSFLERNFSKRRPLAQGQPLDLDEIARIQPVWVLSEFLRIQLRIDSPDIRLDGKMCKTW